MSEADSPSAAVPSSGHIVLHPTAAESGWRGTIPVLLIVLAPVGLAALLVTIGLFVVASWQLARGTPVNLPTPVNVRLYGMFAYAVACWFAVAVAARWSSRRGLKQHVFAFRRLTWPALTMSIVAFVIAMYGVPIVTRWLSHETGGPSHGVRIDFHDAQSVAVYLILFVITAPVCEEILYRGLLVTWLRRIGWSDSAVLLAGSLIFGANHILPLGFVWGVAMVGFGAILFVLRLRYDSLSPGWLTHLLFNAQPFVTYPLIAWIAPAALPGRL
ncbi:CPBP family intramembrane glutamic endopeptidase [Bradyrhizobium sp.]|uniref:CPBP family intramembrane glutamic endopeptidase n=1 Tax=Bradyrhizobium sp. TaxID=376 RepID=UPI002392BD8A|nr:CPBP family intramembrane glutamic endopeptidase [Bradyrhizobium sp.]MDE2379973.1 CPBP family intramembrane metalloprotease [Bradyrhizobium sp.]